MSGDLILVLVLVAGSTLGLFHYVRVVLPQAYERRARQSARAFGTAIELRVPAYAGLTAEVVSLALKVGTKMGLSRSQLVNLEMAANLRDIGICAIPFRMMNQHSADEWTPAERATYRRHPEVSAAMLELVPTMRHLSGIVRCHHAPYDGSSGPTYPVRTDIPIEARILCVVAAFVWVRRVHGERVAREQLESQRGGRFDPTVVEVTLSMLTSPRAGDSRSTYAA